MCGHRSTGRIGLNLEARAGGGGRGSGSGGRGGGGGAGGSRGGAPGGLGGHLVCGSEVRGSMW